MTNARRSKKRKKKGPLGKLKDKIDDSEEQLAILYFVRLGILVWSGGILTLAYIKLPPALGIPERKVSDPDIMDNVFAVFWTFKLSPDGEEKW